MRLHVTNLDGREFEGEIAVTYQRAELKLEGNSRTIKGWECLISYNPDRSPHPDDPPGVYVETGGLCVSDPQASASAAFDQAMDILYDEVAIGTAKDDGDGSGEG